MCCCLAANWDWKMVTPVFNSIHSRGGCLILRYPCSFLLVFSLFSRHFMGSTVQAMPPAPRLHHCDCFLQAGADDASMHLPCASTAQKKCSLALHLLCLVHLLGFRGQWLSSRDAHFLGIGRNLAILYETPPLQATPSSISTTFAAEHT